MNVVARNYTSGAEIIANANATRKRLMSPANAFRPEKAPLTLIVIEPRQPTPQWQKQDIQFDEHIKDWRWHRITVKSNRYKEYVIKRCIELGVDYKAIVGRSLLRSLTGPRQLIMYEMKTELGLSYPRIAREFGDRDHTSIVSAVQRIASIRGEATPEKVNSQDRILRDRDLNDAIRRDYKAGSPVDALAVKFNISARAISAVVRIENWSRDRRDRSGVSGSAKLNMAAVRRDYERGYGLKKLAGGHGVSVRTITRLVKDNGWTRKVEE